MKLAFVLAFACVLGLVATTSRAAKGEKKSDKLHGKISAIAGDGKTFTLVSGKEKNETTVTVDANTTYMVDDKEAKFTDLAVDDHVVVEPATGTATTVKAQTPAYFKEHHHKAKKPETTTTTTPPTTN